MFDDPSDKEHEVLAKYGVSLHEWLMLININYGPKPLRSAAAIAAAEAKATQDALTDAEAEVALDSCMRKGWLRVIDDKALEEIQSELQEKGYIGPVYDLPWAGSVDFTAEGARRATVAWMIGRLAALVSEAVP